jgi:hypothetical protein
MGGTAPAAAVELLEYLHAKLDAHFRQLQARRAQLNPVSPVFALEHDLDETELALLKFAVESAIRVCCVGGKQTSFPLCRLDQMARASSVKITVS